MINYTYTNVDDYYGKTKAKRTYEATLFCKTLLDGILK